LDFSFNELPNVGRGVAGLPRSGTTLSQSPPHRPACAEPEPSRGKQRFVLMNIGTARNDE